MPAQKTNRKLVHDWIAAHSPEGGRVLDIGCGEGDLLARLVQEKHVSATGLELSEAFVFQAIQRGLSVHHGNVEEGLDHYGDNSFDLVILSLTIQELGHPLTVLRETFRVGKNVLIVFPNFGHWRARLQLAFRGRAPYTPSLPYTWYDSPNRHYLTTKDWEDLCNQEKWTIRDRGFIADGHRVTMFPNLVCEVAMYLLTSG